MWYSSGRTFIFRQINYSLFSFCNHWSVCFRDLCYKLTLKLSLCWKSLLVNSGSNICHFIIWLPSDRFHSTQAGSPFLLEHCCKTCLAFKLFPKLRCKGGFIKKLLYLGISLCASPPTQAELALSLGSDV